MPFGLVVDEGVVAFGGVCGVESVFDGRIVESCLKELLHCFGVGFGREAGMPIGEQLSFVF